MTRPPKSAAAPLKKAVADRPATITLKKLAEEVALSYDDVPLAHAEILFGDLINAAIRHLKIGNTVRFNGLGQLMVKDLPARSVRNPRTGETVLAAACRKIQFRISKDLKTRMEAPSSNDGED